MLHKEGDVANTTSTPALTSPAGEARQALRLCELRVRLDVVNNHQPEMDPTPRRPALEANYTTLTPIIVLT